jgi:Uma2 family endonuclease
LAVVILAEGSSMAQITESILGTWTVADLVERFGEDIPLYRIRQHPPPGTATERDVIEIHDRENRLCELVDGVLVEKTVGTYESYLASLLVQILGAFVREHDLGITLAPDGMMRLAPGLVRIPDVSFISWQRLPGGTLPDEPIAGLSPNLAIEVISQGNTRKEMERKLSDYFAAGAEQVWYIYHIPRREVWVYTSPTDHVVLDERQTLDGSDLLPGFRLELKGLFAKPGRAEQG